PIADISFDLQIHVPFGFGVTPVLISPFHGLTSGVSTVAQKSQSAAGGAEIKLFRIQLNAETTRL
ncbi:MAG TPA: hypothetical protein VGG66_06955, partial [Rhizomicrobium sp.]